MYTAVSLILPEEAGWPPGKLHAYVTFVRKQPAVSRGIKGFPAQTDVAAVSESVALDRTVTVLDTAFAEQAFPGLFTSRLIVYTPGLINLNCGLAELGPVLLMYTKLEVPGRQPGRALWLTDQLYWLLPHNMELVEPVAVV